MTYFIWLKGEETVFCKIAVSLFWKKYYYKIQYARQLKITDFPDLNGCYGIYRNL